jgi:hypothetical protein
MTKLKSTVKTMKLPGTTRKPRTNKVPMPLTVPDIMKDEFDVIVLGLQNAGYYKASMLPSIECYLMSVFMLREASKAVQTYGLFDAEGNQTQAALMLHKMLSSVKAQASALGLTTLAKDLGARKDSVENESAEDDAKAQSTNPWLQPAAGGQQHG